MLIAHSEKAAAPDVEHAYLPLRLIDEEALDMADVFSVLIDDGSAANVLPPIC